MCIKSRLLALWFGSNLISTAYNKSGETENTPKTFSSKYARVEKFVRVAVHLKNSHFPF